MRVAKTRRFFQCLQYVTPGRRVVIHAQQLCETEMHIGRIGGIKQQQFLVSPDGGPGFAEFFTGATQEAIR